MLRANMHIYSDVSSKFHMQVRMGGNQGVGKNQRAVEAGRGAPLCHSLEQHRYAHPHPAGSAGYEVAVGTLHPCAILFLREVFRADPQLLCFHSVWFLEFLP